MTRQAFFEDSVSERDLGDDFLEFLILGAQVFDFVAGRFADCVPCELLLARFEEILAPAVVEVRGDSFAAAQL